MKLTKIFRTETAHRLYEYNGACSNIHGHSYKFVITIEVPELNSLGIGMDFKDIKAEVGNLINVLYDHALVLNSDDPLVPLLEDSKLKIMLMRKENPTAENMAKQLWRLLSQKLSAGLVSIEVWETETAYATLGA